MYFVVHQYIIFSISYKTRKIKILLYKNSQHTVRKLSLNSGKPKKNFLLIPSIFSKFGFLRKRMRLEVFEFQESFMIGTFFIESTQFEKTG